MREVIALPPRDFQLMMRLKIRDFGEVYCYADQVRGPEALDMLAAMATAGWLVARGRTRSRRYEPSARLAGLPLRSPEIMRILRAGGQLDLWPEARHPPHNTE